MTEERDCIGDKVGELKRRVLVGIAAVFVLLAAAVSVVGLLQPRRYFAKVTMEVKSSEAPLQDSESKFVAAQFELMRGQEILYPVIERLGLGKAFAEGTERLSADQVYPLLLRSLDFRQIRNTHLVEIGVYSSDPQLAANIANTIAVIYEEKRRQDEENAAMRRFAEQKEERHQRAELVKQLASAMTKMRDQEGIIDPDPMSQSAAISSPKGKDSIANYTEAKSRYIQAVRSLAILQPLPDCHGRIWEKAEPPQKPVRVGFRRFW